MDKYKEFLKTKVRVTQPTGFEIPNDELNQHLMDFQKDIVTWAVKKGKACIFADCGLGKTLMQLNWAEAVNKKTGKPILILAPLAVSEQTRKEGEKFGIEVEIVKEASEVINGINVTNYEKLDKFDPEIFSGIVLDESSILKSYSGKTRNKIIESFKDTPYKLCCTATPAPNDYMELGNHCEFMSIMPRNEMLAMFFQHDGSETSKWELKGHASKDFWRWLATWALFVKNPKELGYEVDGFDLPELKLNEIIADSNFYALTTQTLRQRQQARRDTIEVRGVRAIELAREFYEKGEQCLIWCDLNKESELINKGLGTISEEIAGSTKEEKRLDIIDRFTNGKLPVLITKPSIAGFGMNWQNCHNMIFVGLSDSYEKFYQAVRRCYRFGQKENVNVFIIISHLEGTVLENIKRKDRDSNMMNEKMKGFILESVRGELNLTDTLDRDYKPRVNMILPDWKEFKVC